MNKWITVVLLFLNRISAQSTLLETLSTIPNVSQFRKNLQETKITALEFSTCKNAEACITVLPHTDDAWEKIAPGLGWPTLSLEKKQNIMYGQYLTSPKQGQIPIRLSTGNWQSVGVKLNLIDIGLGSGSMFQELSGPRYAFSSNSAPFSYFINDAKVVQADVTASNGVIQIMDRVVYYPHESETFYEYLQATPALSKTFALWRILMTSGDPKYIALISQLFQGSNLFATYFVVPNSVWDKLPESAYTNLLNNNTLLVEILSMHYAPNQLLFPRWSENNRLINFHVGFPTDPLPGSINQNALTKAQLLPTSQLPIIILNGMNVQTLNEGLALQRAVAIEISSPLGYLYESMQSFIARTPEIGIFVNLCTMDTNCNTLLHSNADKTIFAPTESAMGKFSSIPPDLQAEYLKLMIVPGRITPLAVENYVQVGNVTDAIRFLPINNVMHVEGRIEGHGYVGTSLTSAKCQCQDGIIYVINAILGYPVQTIREMLASNENFMTYLSTNIIDEQSIGGPYTFFAPTESAFAEMRADGLVGAKLFEDSIRRTFVLRRLIYPMKLLLNEMKSPQAYDVATANYAFTREYVRMDLSRQSNVFVSVINGSVKVVSSDGGYECVDGWLYQVNSLLYTEADLTISTCSVPGCL